MNKMIVVLVTLLISLLIGCTNTIEEKTESTASLLDYESALQLFLNGGCKYYEGDNNEDAHINCDNSDVHTVFDTFQCDRYYSVYDEGMVLGLPLIECSTKMHDVPTEERDQYFSCSGGEEPYCHSLITATESGFTQIKNKEQLLSLIGPIDAAEKAQSYVVAVMKITSYGVSQDLWINDQKMFEGSVEQVEETYYVTFYKPKEFFGCYDEINYEAITYEVATDGEISEKDREVVYTKDLDGIICTD